MSTSEESKDVPVGEALSAFQEASTQLGSAIVHAIQRGTADAFEQVETALREWRNFIRERGTDDD